MGKTAALRAKDWRAILRVVGECRDLGDDAAAWGLHLSAAIAALVGSPYAIVGEAVREPGGVVRLGAAESWGWENGFDRGVFLETIRQVDRKVESCPLVGHYFLREDEGGPAYTVPDIIAEADWLASSYFRDVHEPIGFGHTVSAFLHRPDGMYSTLALSHLKSERRDFDPRTRTLVAEALAAITPLVGGALAGRDEPSPTDLPPRARRVLRCLLEGEGDKQIAARLNLSRHTVNEYVKLIFATFGVRSRSELMSRWVSRGWGRRAGWAE